LEAIDKNFLSVDERELKTKCAILAGRKFLCGKQMNFY
jgi:hypothetical protein